MCGSTRCFRRQIRRVFLPVWSPSSPAPAPPGTLIRLASSWSSPRAAAGCSAREAPREIGAVFIGATAGYRNLIGIDIGGTSADITLVHDGEPGLTTSGHIGDWPLGLPMIDITTIGAGGGSIARYSRDGALTVWPQSAGADSGPGLL